MTGFNAYNMKLPGYNFTSDQLHVKKVGFFEYTDFLNFFITGAIHSIKRS